MQTECMRRVRDKQVRVKGMLVDLVYVNRNLSDLSFGLLLNCQYCVLMIHMDMAELCMEHMHIYIYIL